ncbi:MAG: glycosyltransferase family 4 protein, partial [Pseudomonadota bacterium]
GGLHAWTVSKPTLKWARIDKTNSQKSAIGYAIEYSAALFWEFVLSIRAHFKVGFDTVQACNPPDLIFIVAAFWKYLFGKPFIFDHHDINPELYEAKFGKRGVFHTLLCAFERMTFAMADTSIATNATFKSIAIERGRMDPDDVFIVHSVPNLDKFKRIAPDLRLKNGRRKLIGYVGIMGAQDGVDLLVDAMDHLVNGQGRTDIQCAIVGSGTELEALKAQVADLGLNDFVTFTGFLSGDELLAALSAFDAGIIPDPKNSYNDKISMNKLFEYMSLGIPFVQFDLIEGRRTAGDAALYAADNCPHALASEAARLLDAPELHAQLSAAGKARAASMLNWKHEAAQLVAAYDTALDRKRSREDSGMSAAKPAGVSSAA